MYGIKKETLLKRNEILYNVMVNETFKGNNPFEGGFKKPELEVKPTSFRAVQGFLISSHSISPHWLLSGKRVVRNSLY